jgi:hypothetical protein
MFSVCANPECHAPFDYDQGRLFRFHKNAAAGGNAPNTHSVQHFWLCSTCLRGFTLEYESERGVLIKTLPVMSADPNAFRFIAAA